jgi:hypothetical protein
MATIVGCVYKERDVPGRAPNVAERAGILEDYILAEMKPTTQQTGAAEATAPADKMYKLEGIADERLQTVVGKRVEVKGRIDAEVGDSMTGSTGAPPAAGAAPAADKSLGPDDIELPEFEVTSMREIDGTCPSSPASSR